MLTGVLQLLKGNGAGEGKPVSGLTVTQGTDDSDLEEERVNCAGNDTWCGFRGIF